MPDIQPYAGSVARSPEYKKLRNYLITSLVNELGSNPPEASQYRQVVEDRLEKLSGRLNLKLSPEIRSQLYEDIMNDLAGYGPIQPLLADPDISEIMVNGPDLVFIERNGELIETGIKFDNNEHVLRVINRMIHPLGRRVDAETPMVDARLPDGSRVNAVIPPVAVDGPTISIRKFLRNKMTMEQIIALDSITPHMAEFLQACVAARLNILISGGTSSGKTTMLNILSRFIPENERIVTIEDSAELQMKQEHVVRLETRPPNIEGRGEVTARDLVRNSLRMRPDRIILGEVRSAEVLDMLQAMNTGHDGSLATVHANSPRDALMRLETLIAMSGYNFPSGSVRKYISSALNVILQVSRQVDGSRKVVSFQEITGMEGEIITMQEIFFFEQTGLDVKGMVKGRFRATGIRPKFVERFKAAGVPIPHDLFNSEKVYEI